MKQAKKKEVAIIKKEKMHIRYFVKEIHLKLRKQKPQDRKAVSLYQMIVK